MRIRTLVSPLALAVGLTMTGAASAQVTLGDQVVPEEDMVAVQKRCDELALAALNQSGDASSTETDTTDDSSDDSDTDDDGTDDDGTDDGMDDDGTDDTGTDDDSGNGDLDTADEVDNNMTTVELNSITLDQCIEAGLVEGPLPLTD